MKAFIALIIFYSISLGQVNIEKYNNINKTSGISGNIGLYLSAKTGNSDIQEFEIDSRVNFTGQNFYTFLIGKGEYGWNDGKEFSNNALIHLRYIHEFKTWVKPELFAQVNYNNTNLLQFRSLFGIGARAVIISDTSSSLNFGTAYMYEYEDLDLPANAIHTYETFHHRWSNYISYSRKVSKSSRISLVVYAQPRLDKFNDIRILSENHIGVHLSDKLILSLNASIRYDSRPPDGIKDIDTNTKVGLTINL